MALDKPGAVARDPFMSAKWDQLTANRKFDDSAAPLLSALVRQYKDLAAIEAELDQMDGQLVYENARGDLSPLPQYGMHAQAVTQIRMLEKHLGITAAAAPVKEQRKGAKLFVVQANRQSRAKAANRA